MSQTPSLLYLPRPEVERLSAGIDFVAVVRAALALLATGEAILPDEAYLGWRPGTGSARSINMPAYLGGSIRAAGTKIINANPANVARGLPRAQGLAVLFDVDTAAPIAIMDGTFISATRTAAVSALSGRLFDMGSAAVLAVIGTGPIARAHIAAFLDDVPALERVVLFDLSRERAERAAAELRAQRPTVRFDVAGSAEAAVRPGHIVVPATTTTTGYIPLDWLQAGALLINVSLDDALPDVFLGADRVYVDDWNLVRADRRRLLGRLAAEGRVCGPKDGDCDPSCRRLDGELPDVVVGACAGRQHSRERIVVNPFGMAVNDVALAHAVYERAVREGAGLRLPV